MAKKSITYTMERCDEILKLCPEGCERLFKIAVLGKIARVRNERRLKAKRGDGFRMRADAVAGQRSNPPVDHAGSERPGMVQCA